MSPSPWWYRQRALCIAALYCAGFYGAYTLAHLTGRPAIPTYAFFGDRWQTAIASLAVALATIGWCWRAWGTSYLQVAVVWNYDALTDKLYIAGPFRYTRNPLYLGNLFQAAAFAMFAPPVGWWLVVFLQWLFLTALMRVEERGMLARYGAQFDAYRASVPQLLPRPIPVAGESAPHSSFGRALSRKRCLSASHSRCWSSRCSGAKRGKRRGSSRAPARSFNMQFAGKTRARQRRRLVSLFQATRGCA